MKKYFVYFLIISIFVTTIFSFTNLVPLASATTVPTTISQLIELLITIGVIAPDKVVAARAAATSLSQVTVVAEPITSIVSTSTSYIQVLTPNGGQNWDIDLDVTYPITWGSVGLTQVRVALISTAKNSPVCELSQAPIASKDGNHEFRILLKTAKCYNFVSGTSTPLIAGTYRARIYYTDIFGKTIKDESNATFKILPKLIPSIKVTYPNGGENLLRNSDYSIKYGLTNTTKSIDGLVYMYLLDNTGNSVFNSHKALRSDHTYDLDFPSNLSPGAYKVKLKLTTSVDKVEIEDTSDTFFWVSSGL